MERTDGRQVHQRYKKREGGEEKKKVAVRSAYADDVSLLGTN